MKLYARPASPFARKVRVMLIETGLADSTEIQMLSPEELAPTLTAQNPLVKVPTLIRDDGTALYDSPVICEYLDGLHDGQKYFPADGDEKWTALRFQALADGVGDATVNLGAEDRRPEDQRSPDAAERQKTKINNGIDQFEANIEGFSGKLNIAEISVACCLGYLDFRYQDYGWRDSHPNLAAWFEDFSGRDSMKKTNFKRPGS